ncbi:MAG: hypothetical protein GY768_23595 [Planctomycetaceae bacterium]|nr:hypothetical protein [Planctomycetaceae bacterium]
MNTRSRNRPIRRRISPHFESLETRRFLTQVAGAIDIDTVWSLADSPYEVTRDVTVESNATLLIEPGVLVQFRENTDLEVKGRLLAEGTPWQRITFDRAAGESGWDGLKFDGTLQDNRITYTDMLHGDDQGEAIDVSDSRLLIDNMTWSGTSGTILELDHPSLIVRNSHFPTSRGGEIIHGEHISDSEYLIIDGNVFENSNNGGDVIDFLGAERPGPVLQILNNVFKGGGDDGLDLDGTDAHIEGNLFMNFRKNTGRNTTSNAIATGLPQNGDENRTEITVVRNIFVDNDHALLLKEDAFATVQHNVFVGSKKAVIQFNEVGGTAVKGAGRGASLTGNILWENKLLFKNLVSQPKFTTELSIDYSLLPNEMVDLGGTSINAHELGQGNVAGDPQFVNLEDGGFQLSAGSPAIAAGPAGLDMGAYVESGPTVIPAVIDSENDSVTSFLVGGPGMTHYRYRLDDAAYSQLTTIDQPIQFAKLPPGEFLLDVVGMNSAGEWAIPTVPAFGNRIGTIIAPQQVRANEILPIVIRALDWQGNVNSNVSIPVQLDNLQQLDGTDVQIKKGVGSYAPVVNAEADFQLSLTGSDDSYAIQVIDETFPVEHYSGALVGDTVWDANVERRITDDLLIPEGSTLTIQPGTRVLLGDKVNLRVEGTILGLGSMESPLLFNSLSRDLAWGGIEIDGGHGQFSYALMTHGGADNARNFGHSNSQPVVMVRNGTLNCNHLFIVNNVGKAFGARRSQITIDHSIISDVDTGGEFSSSVAKISDTWIKNISNGNSNGFVDDDNDGLYFAGVHPSGEPSQFTDSFVIDTQDDGLDHNGAHLEIVNAWIEGVTHEGIASSNANQVTIHNSVFQKNNQGVEAGYGSPQLVVKQSVITQNTNQIDPNSPITAGLRFGDGYDGQNGDYEGQITAEYLVISDNGDNVRNDDGTIPGARPGAIAITNSMTNDKEFNRTDKNTTGIPIFSNSKHLLRGSAGFQSGPDNFPLGRSIKPKTVAFSVGSKADFNHDGQLTAEDIDLLCEQIQQDAPDFRFDLNKDARVDSRDRDELIFSHFRTTYGDANLDGLFDSTDLVQIFQRGLYEDNILRNAGWADGDWNCDSEFSSSDLVLSMQTGDYSDAAASRAAISAALADLPEINDDTQKRHRASPLT